MPNDELPHQSGEHGGGYESSDLNLWVLGRWVLLLFVILFSVVFGMKFLFRFDPVQVSTVSRPGKEKDVSLSKKFPEPLLQTSPRLDWETFRKKEQEILSTYGWSDERRGLTRIPIDVAMELLLKQGLPTSGGKP